MQRGEDEMAGLGRLGSNYGCFLISDFANHQDIRILSQERP